MTTTEWVGGRIAAPLFVEDKGGYQPDVVVWMDATRDLVVGLEMVHPSEPDSAVAEVLRRTLRKPMAGPKKPPGRIRVAEANLAEILAPVARTVPVKVDIAPTPEILHFVRRMGESMPGASPGLADFRKLLHQNPVLTTRLLAAAARLFRSGPWQLLWDSEVLKLDVSELGVSGWCISVMGRAKQTWGIALCRSVAEHALLGSISDNLEEGKPVDLRGVETLSLFFAAVGELPTLIRRELVELGWELSDFDVYPFWVHPTSDGKAQMPTEQDLRLLLAAAVGVAEHVERYREELTAREVPPRLGEYRVETDTGVVVARITSPHPEVSWGRDREQPSCSESSPICLDASAIASAERERKGTASAREPARVKPGRNEPCHCGSGRKYKQCCLDRDRDRDSAAPRYTARDRESAFAKLERFSDEVVGGESDLAYDELFDDRHANMPDLDEKLEASSDDVLDMWFWFDRPLDDGGSLVVDRLLAEDRSIADGERCFLELARGTCMRLYEIVDVCPGVSLTMRDVFDNATVTVQEKGSRQLKRADIVAARIIRPGVSGMPEMERGV
ncbi:MAG: SEC-C metal-binding domain-containing protein, partial [Pseudomonadota bacterium]